MPQPWEKQYAKPPDASAQDALAQDQPPGLLYGAVRGFGQNLVGSAGQFASNLAEGVGQAVMHPFDTAQGIGRVAAGAIEKMAPLPQPGPHEPYAEAAGNAIRTHVQERYGSPAQFAETLYQDPVGTMADVSMVLAPAGAGIRGLGRVAGAANMGRTASALQGVGEAVGTAAAMTDPVRAVGQVATLPPRAFGITPQTVYQSAIKPPPGSFSLPEVRNMVRTGLENRIPMSESGLTRLWGLIDDLNTRVTDRVAAAAQRGVTIDPQAVARRVDEITPTFSEQVNPNRSLRQLADSRQEFLGRNQGQAPFSQVLPSLDEGGGYFPVGTGSTPYPIPIPADRAQRTKVGTYRQLRNAYGEMRNAETEAQKALARGLREELADNIPEIGALNAQESDFLQLVPVLERAVRREGNHQIFGIGTPIFGGAVASATGSPLIAGAAATARAILDNPNVKSRLAIAVYQGMKKNPGRFGPARMATATSRVEEYLRGLQQMVPEQQGAPAPAAP